MTAAGLGLRLDFALWRELTGHPEEVLLTQVKEWIGVLLLVEASAAQLAFRSVAWPYPAYAWISAGFRGSLPVSLRTGT